MLPNVERSMDPRVREDDTVVRPSSSTPLKILCVFGTRPEAIKMAPVVQALRARPTEFSTVVVLTAQHRSMLDQVMTLFKLSSDYDLNVMQANQTLEHVVTAVLQGLGPILDKEKPDLILVHGDTVTTFAAALSAFYHRVPIGHVEAGLRSYDMDNPFPEESNRVLADHLCTLYFAPTAQSKANLLKENISPDKIFVTGNTVTDALLIALKASHGWTAPALRDLAASGVLSEKHRLILVTAHRRENHGAPLEQVFRALRRITDHYPDVHIVYPVHLNPNVQKPAQAILGGHERIHLLPPVDYDDLVQLLKLSSLVVTDSGGIQEEAPVLGKPVLVLRKVTERPEAVQAGTAQVVGVDEEEVFASIDRLLSDRAAYDRMANAVNPYGDGKASDRILGAIRFHFEAEKQRPAEFTSTLTP